MCFLGSDAGLGESVVCSGKYLPASLLIAVEAHEPGDQQAADDRYQGRAGEDDCGQERRGVNGHGKHARSCDMGKQSRRAAGVRGILAWPRQ